MIGLEVRDLTVRYGRATGVESVSLDVPRGRIVALLGPSGSGKSTLLRAIAGIERASVGSVSFEGSDLARVPVHRRGFALMFQDGQLFEHRSVARNVGYGLKFRQTTRAGRRARVRELLDVVGLPELAKRMPSTLSGGQRQRVALARALAVNPRLLLLDEPLSSLDRSHREELAAHLREVLTTSGVATLLVTHDHEEAFAIADDLVIMRDGQIVQSGPITDVWRSPADEWVARFLGYPTVLTGDAAALLLATLPGDRLEHRAVALRRSALQVVSDGPLAGVVRSTRAATDVVRLTVDIDGLGAVPAVADAGAGVAPGDRVRIRVNRDRLATLE